MSLNVANAFANRNATTDLVLQQLSTGQMVGVCMCLENPLQRQILGSQVVHDVVDGRRIRTTRNDREAEYRIDNGGACGFRIADDVGQRPAGGMMKVTNRG